MKSTGIVRKVDSLGRIVLPIELRRVMGIDIKDPIEIFVDDSHIVELV
jgi:transcriptional pleiotropic regulator of transition state genes